MPWTVNREQPKLVLDMGTDKRKLLIVEDEPKLAKTISEGLATEGYLPQIAASGEEALFVLSRESFDLILLDVMLPGRNGFDVVRLLRQKNEKTPVLMLTARDSVEDRVLGLDSGADDYLVKPFAFAELLARIRVILKRNTNESSVQLAYSDLQIDLLTREVKRANKKLDLTVKEFELLEYLIRHKNEVVTRDMLARDVWKETTRATPLDNVIDVHVARLRKKVDLESMPPLIQTVRGVGFSLRESK